MGRRAGVFTTAGHKPCARCGHARHLHVSRPVPLCAAIVYQQTDSGTYPGHPVPARCRCHGYRLPKGS